MTLKEILEEIKIRKPAEVFPLLLKLKKPVLLDKETENLLDTGFTKLRKLEKETVIYGVHTGLGPFVKYKNTMPYGEMLQHLLTGTGNAIPEKITELALLLRILTLSRGYSGVSPEFISYLLKFYNLNAIPVVPERGSLGASGDLIPLAMMLHTFLGGENACIKFNHKIFSAKKFLMMQGIQEKSFHKKEMLSFINGLSVSKSYLVLSTYKFSQILKLLQELYLLNYVLIGANLEHLRNELLQLHNLGCFSYLLPEKEKILGLLKKQFHTEKPRPLQEIYTLRCGYQILGAVHEHLDFIEKKLKEELLAIDDNPLLIEDGVYHGGNFFGQNLAFLADELNMLTIQTGVWIERLVKTLLDPVISGEAFMMAENPESSFGYAGMEILSTSLLAELRSGGHFHSTFSIPTNGNNQDIVPMANLAVRKVYYQLDILADMVFVYAIILAGFHEYMKKTYGQNITVFPENITLYLKNLMEQRWQGKPHSLLKKIKRRFERIIFS